jgi:DNA-binding CsgD family transcriptional regulator
MWEATWARLDLASGLLRSNRHAEAMTVLETARATAAGLDSEPLLARADELMRVARGRGATEEPWRPLTVREYEVARLIGEGMTNAAIARQLEISPKTASAHVEHILAKLGATRRTEIATWVAAIGGRFDGAVATGRREQSGATVAARAGSDGRNGH